MPTQKILILDGDAMASLAFARSLGRIGVHVTVAEARADAILRASRFCKRFVRYPSPLQSPDRFREWLLLELSRHDYDFLLGTTDYTVPLLYQWRDELGKHVRLPLACTEAFDLFFDKASTLAFAAKQGIQVPQTFYPVSINDVDSLAATPTWPKVLKPRFSVIEKNGRRHATIVEYAFDSHALRRALDAMFTTFSSPMLQTYVCGEGVGCFFLLHEGEVLARFQHRRIRDTRPTGSGSCYRVSTAPTPRLMEISEGLLKAARWNGLAMVEFRVDSGKSAHLMEVNPRPWGSMQLAVEAGVDFPLLWWRAVSGESVEPIREYRVGVHGRFLRADLQHLESVMLGPPPGWALPFPKRLATLRAFVRFWDPGVRYDDFGAGDWGPGLWGLFRYAREAFGRMGAKVSRVFSRTRS